MARGQWNGSIEDRRGGGERRVSDEPIDFPDRRKGERRSGADRRRSPRNMDLTHFD